MKPCASSRSRVARCSCSTSPGASSSRIARASAAVTPLHWASAFASAAPNEAMSGNAVAITPAWSNETPETVVRNRKTSRRAVSFSRPPSRSAAAWPRDRVGGERLRRGKRHAFLLRFDLNGRRWRSSFDRRGAFRGDLGNRWRGGGGSLGAKVFEGREGLLALFDSHVRSGLCGDRRFEDPCSQSVFGGQVRRRPLASA